MSDQIITSRLDNDFYAFTMGQLIWRHFQDVVVKYKFFNRGTILDPSLLPKLEEQIRNCYSLRVTNDEVDYLYSLGMFDINYLQWLHNSWLPEVHCWIEDDSIQMEFIGPWASAVFWETPLLAIMTELHMQSYGKYFNADSMLKFFDKSELLDNYPNIKIMEFGSRRRASKDNQDNILHALQRYNAKNLLGTSNVMFAKELGLKPMGTMAHQLFMVLTAIAKNATSNDWMSWGTQSVLYLFEQMYANHPEMLIYLPDTYGTAAGLSLMNKQQALTWAGVRQDSGTPANVVRIIRNWYLDQGIDPRSKLIIPSDGLTIPKVIELYEEFHNECTLAFGVGTNLTNDIGLAAPNFVIKPVSANGHPCVKLSDSRGKITGNSQLAEEYVSAALDLRGDSL